MQVAAILTDLTSLRVCDPSAAMALVSARPQDNVQKITLERTDTDTSDPDLKRARDLLELHATVKVAHQGSVDKELNDARDAVDRALQDL